jgi:hypothetical protein
MLLPKTAVNGRVEGGDSQVNFSSGKVTKSEIFKERNWK